MADAVDESDQPDAAASGDAVDPAERPAYIRERVETLRVRRSPKYSVFLMAGAALGIVVAMILTLVFGDDEAASRATGFEYSTTQVFGFLALICISVGLAVGGLVALGLDRALARRTREVTVGHETIHIDRP